MNTKLKPAPKPGTDLDPAERPHYLWQLWDAFLLDLLERFENRKSKPLSPQMMGVTLAFLKFQGVKADLRVAGSVHRGLGRLVEVSGLNTPFGPPTSISTITKKEPGKEDDK